MERIDGYKTLIFVHVTLYLLPLFIIKSHFLYRCQSIEKGSQNKIMRTFFRLCYNVTQKLDNMTYSQTCSKITQTHLLTPHNK